MRSADSRAFVLVRGLGDHVAEVADSAPALSAVQLALLRRIFSTPNEARTAPTEAVLANPTTDATSGDHHGERT